MRNTASPLRRGRAWLCAFVVLGASAASLLLAPLPAMLTVGAVLAMLAADESVAQPDDVHRETAPARLPRGKDR